ncbi:MAG: chloride channel protein [Bacteroidales bacterium]|nr:chloride channel protein [Bacteroidales bacterium]MCD8394020.1 chloride channel protein [Bacteroidales bacterium]
MRGSVQPPRRSVRQVLDAFASDCRRHVSQKAGLIMLSFLVGILCGGAATLMKLLVGWIHDLAMPSVPGGRLCWWLLLVPVVGVLIVGAFCRYVVKDNIEHGTELIRKHLTLKRYRMRRSTMWSSLVGASITLGCGGSAGAEGPIALTGAGLGSNLGKYFRLPDKMIGVLLAVGAGAGIAGIFKSPIGGALYTIEVLAMQLSVAGVIALFAACLTSSTVAYLLSGMTLDIDFVPRVEFSPQMTLAAIILGVICGVYSFYYSHTMRLTENRLDALRNPWVKNVASGLLIGVIVMFFPTLYGEGYGIIGDSLGGHFERILGDTLWSGATSQWALPLLLGAVLLLKGIACSATNSGGGVAGDFTPTLFAGAMLGTFAAMTANALWGLDMSVSDYAFWGMAGVMAGAIQAPLMAIFLVAEMSGDLRMFFPLMVVAVISYSVVSLLSHHWVPIRRTWLHNDFHKLLK